MVICVDLDGMLLAFPKFFQEFFKSMQSGGSKIGILTARPDSDKETLLDMLHKMDIIPDFFVGMPDEMKDANFSQGLFKAQVCNDLEVDLLFDDFQYSDPKMIADFFTHNTRTVPFTSWAYDPDK